jgi:hypothetical protein
MGITIDGDGNVYTANATSNNVSKITPAGVSTILGVTDSSPFNLIVDGAGNIYISNQGSGNVSKITPAGVSTILGTAGTNPTGIIMDGDGNIYTSNYRSNDVSKITPAGVSTILGVTDDAPLSITMDGVGNIYTANANSSNVSKITPAGVSTIIGSTGSGAYSINIDGFNNIYVPNQSDNNVTKITNPTISEVTLVPTPIILGNPLTYTFNTNSAGTITYGGSCTSGTGSAVAGDNSITFDPLSVGTYNDCTIVVTDGFGPSNTLAVSSFTVIDLPALTTSPATSVVRDAATLNGEITDNGGANVTERGFEYGLDTSYGLITSENSGPYGENIYSANVTSLDCESTYHYRSYAVNSAGTGYGSDVEFTTGSCLVSSGGGSSTSSPITEPLPPVPEPEPVPTPTPEPEPAPPPTSEPNEIPEPVSSTTDETTPPDATSPSAPSSTSGDNSSFETPPSSETPIFSTIVERAGKVAGAMTTYTRIVTADPAVKLVANTAVVVPVAASLIVVASSALAGVPLSNYLFYLLVILAQILGFKKRPKPWGTVYDSVTKRPLPYVRVEVLNEEGRKLQSTISDANGRYGFLISQQLQNVQLNAHVTKYDFPSREAPSIIERKLYPNIYQGGMVNASEGAMNLDIPMDPRDKAIPSSIYLGITSIQLNNFLASAANVLFVLGATFGLANAIVNPSVVSISIIVLIFLTYILRVTGFRLKPFGLTKDIETARTLPFGLITLHHPDGERINFTVSDERGRYFMLTPKGEYLMRVYTPSHIVPNRMKEVSISTNKGWISREVVV